VNRIRFLPGILIILVVLLLGLWALIACLGPGTWRFWNWDAQSWEAVGTGLGGTALTIFAFFAFKIQDQQRQLLHQQIDRQMIEQQATTAQELLSEVLAIMSLQEGWMTEGDGWERTQPLSEHKDLPLESGNVGVRLCRVEVRAVCDDARWNAPAHQFFRLIEGRRTWIVRDQVQQDSVSYYGALEGVDRPFRPALLSSRALQGLCAWIARVGNANASKLLSTQGLDMLRPYLVSVMAEDRVEVLDLWLSEEATTFLTECRNWWQ